MKIEIGDYVRHLPYHDPNGMDGYVTGFYGDNYVLIRAKGRRGSIAVRRDTIVNPKGGK